MAMQALWWEGEHMTELLRLRHEVRDGYKGCCRCSKRFLPYYVGSDGHWYCEDCGQELVKKKKIATFGKLGDPNFKFNFRHPRCQPPTPQDENPATEDAKAYCQCGHLRDQFHDGGSEGCCYAHPLTGSDCGCEKYQPADAKAWEMLAEFEMSGNHWRDRDTVQFAIKYAAKAVEKAIGKFVEKADNLAKSMHAEYYANGAQDGDCDWTAYSYTAMRSVAKDAYGLEDICTYNS